MASAIKRIIEYNAGIPGHLHDLKWQALKESPFRFFRGTCHIFAGDFVKLYKYKPKVRSWICGDLHFENFGSFKGENRLVYFDLNDFDEAILASPEPEITRFLASVIIAAHQMKASSLRLHKTLHDIVDAYVETLQAGKALMLEQEVAHGEFRKYFERLSTFDRQAFIAKRTTKKKGVLQLKPDNIHFITVNDEQKNKIYHALAPLMDTSHFRHLVFEDAAERIAGTGSLGQERYGVLCYSNKKGKHYLIDVKEARQSCYKNLVKIKQPRFKNEAERINMVGYLMQFNSPAFIASVQMDRKWFRVRELQLTEDRMDLAHFGTDFGLLSEVAAEMAVLLGYAHIRSSGHLGASTADELMDFAGRNQWQRDIIELSGELAKRNNKYYQQFMNI